MNDNKYTEIEWIERFFERELTPEELTIFDKKIQKDNKFAKEVTLYRIAHEKVAKIYGDNEAKQQQINEWKEILIKNRKKRLWKNIGVLFVLLLSLFLAWRLLKSPSSTIENPHSDPIALAKNAWSTGPQLKYDDIRNIDSLENIQKEILAIYKTYQAKNYENVIKTATSFNLHDKYYEDAQLMLALSYYHQNNKKQAIQTLKQLINEVKNSARIGLAFWYVAIIHLESGNIEKTEQHLQTIIDNKYSTSFDAQELLDKLKEKQ